MIQIKRYKNYKIQYELSLNPFSQVNDSNLQELQNYAVKDLS